MTAVETGLAAVALGLAIAGARPARADEALARTSGCLECHGVTEKVIGPAWQDVARRYRGQAGARARLIEKVKKGGKGNWTAVTGGVPMPPHSPRLPDEQIRSLVDWILGL